MQPRVPSLQLRVPSLQPPRGRGGAGRGQRGLGRVGLGGGRAHRPCRGGAPAWPLRAAVWVHRAAAWVHRAAAWVHRAAAWVHRAAAWVLRAAAWVHRAAGWAQHHWVSACNACGGGACTHGWCVPTCVCFSDAQDLLPAKECASGLTVPSAVIWDGSEAPPYSTHTRTPRHNTHLCMHRPMPCATSMDTHPCT